MPPFSPTRRLGALALLLIALLAPATSAHASVASRMVSIARSELEKGVREIPDGSNRGTRIRMYGGSTSPRFYPAPWCAYFVSWVSRSAGNPLGPAGQGFGYVPYIKAWAVRTKRWKKAPRSGDLVMFPQHVGMVERVYKNGTLTTIEGNSSNRVARRWRRWGEASGYVRVATGGTVSKGRPKATDPKKPARRPEKLVARISMYPSTTVAVQQEVGFSANDSSGDIARYAWDLDGDGKFDDAKGDNAKRRYAKAGTVKVGLRVTDKRGRTAVRRETLTIRDNRAPTAVLEMPRTVEVNEKIEASAEGSSDPDGEIARYEWDLDGDGQWEENDEHKTITYTRPGVHTAGLRVYDDRGAVGEAIVTINVTSTPPVARATGPWRMSLNRDATFDASRSMSPVGAALAWEWDFDGDGAADASGKKPTWKYATPGDRDVRVVVVDQWGARAETELHVEVVNEAPTGRITVGKAVAGDNVTLDGGGSTDDARIVKHEWDLDNDGTWDATGSKVQWRYAAGGTARAKLRVTDEYGAQSVASAYVRVLERPRARIALLWTPVFAGQSAGFSANQSWDPDGSIERLDWDFDNDGKTDHTTWSANHKTYWTYPAAGTRTAAVTVTDDDGLTSRATMTVTVQP